MECGCRAGFRLQQDGRTCLDVDECEVEDICGHGDCLNLEGSYTCSCHKGYSGQHLCQDIDECEVRNRNIPRDRNRIKYNCSLKAFTYKEEPKDPNLTNCHK